MNVGVLGSGEVGKTLARGFAERGHAVVIGSRDPAKLGEFVTSHKGDVRAGTFEEAAGFGEVVVIATLFAGTMQALDLAGVANFNGKIVMDVTNPLLFEEGKPPQLSVGFSDSGGEQIQRKLPGAKVVKVFNTIGSGYMIDPEFQGGPPTMFIAGDDDAAKKLVSGIVESFGWPGEVVDVGGIVEARVLEPLCILWIHYGIRTGTWHHAFKLLRT